MMSRGFKFRFLFKMMGRSFRMNRQVAPAFWIRSLCPASVQPPGSPGSSHQGEWLCPAAHVIHPAVLTGSPAHPSPPWTTSLSCGGTLILALDLGNGLHPCPCSQPPALCPALGHRLPAAERSPGDAACPLLPAPGPWLPLLDPTRLLPGPSPCSPRPGTLFLGWGTGSSRVAFRCLIRCRHLTGLPRPRI